MLVLYGMYNSIQFGSVEDKSTTYIYIYIYILRWCENGESCNYIFIFNTQELKYSDPWCRKRDGNIFWPSYIFLYATSHCNFWKLSVKKLFSLTLHIVLGIKKIYNTILIIWFCATLTFFSLAKYFQVPQQTLISENNWL